MNISTPISLQQRILMQMALTSFIVAAILVVLSWSSNWMLFYIALVIAAFDLVSMAMAYRGRADWGFHVFFLVHIVAFTLAPYLGIGAICDGMIFPVIYVWVLFSMDNTRVGRFYIILTTICALLTIGKMREVMKSGDQMIPVYQDALIAVGIMICLYFIAKLYFKKVEENAAMRDRRENQIREKNSQLERYIETNLQLENFAHIASHELKTPVRGISNYAGLLHMSADDKLNESEREYLGFIRGQSKRMYALTNDLLDLARLSNGKELRVSTFDTRAMIDDVINRDFSEDREVISVGELPTTLMANEDQLSTVMKNLIENALKYGQSDGPAKIKIYGSTIHDWHHLHVVDNGPGIDERHREKVFLIFKRLQADNLGTGIGLSLCKRIVENHGGVIRIDEAPGGGTDMHISLPTAVTS